MVNITIILGFRNNVQMICIYAVLYFLVLRKGSTQIINRYSLRNAVVQWHSAGKWVVYAHIKFPVSKKRSDKIIHFADNIPVQKFVRIWLPILSKAFIKSMDNIDVWFLLGRFLQIMWSKHSIASVVLRPDWKLTSLIDRFIGFKNWNNGTYFVELGENTFLELSESVNKHRVWFFIQSGGFPSWRLFAGYKFMKSNIVS